MFENDEVFVTKWLGDRGSYVGLNKCSNFVSGKLNLNNEYNFLQLLIKEDKENEFTVKILKLCRHCIENIEFKNDLANLRTQRQIGVYDVVNDTVKGLSVFVYVNLEADLKGLYTFLLYNKAFFCIYDVVFNTSLLQRFFEKEKRKNINFFKYGILKGNHLESCDQLPKHRVCSFDIEVVTKDITYVPNGAGYGDRIVAVSFVIGILEPNGELVKEQEIVYLLWPFKKKPNLKNKQQRVYYFFLSEISLVRSVCNFFQNELDTPFLIGYNVLNFDFPFILNRMVILGLARKYYSVGEINKMLTCLKLPTPCCEKFQIVDLMVYLKKMHADDYSSFSLNSVALQDLNKTKLDISFRDLNMFYENELENSEFAQTLCDYVVFDSELTLEVYAKKKVDKSLFPLVNVCFADTIDYTSNVSSKIINRFLSVMFPSQGLCSYYEKNLKINGVEPIENTGDMYKSKDGKQYCGATVLPTSRMVIANENVSVVDFSSLYPSIIRQYNICFNYVIQDFDPSLYPKNVVKQFLERTHKMERYYTMKRQYSKSPLSVIIEYLITQRKEAKTTYLNYAYKLIANSIYGLLASKGKMRHLPSAALVTSYGRQVHKLVKSFIEDKLNLKVIYGDTDSFFIIIPHNKEINVVKILNNYLREELKLETISLTLDYESLTTVFLAEKKTYLMKLKNGNIKVVGLTKKINLKFKTFFFEFLKLLLDLIHYYFKCKEEFVKRFEILLQEFFLQVLEQTSIEDYMFVCNSKPYYEYKNLSSFNAVCSFRRNLLGADVNFTTVGELNLSYVLPISNFDYTRRKKSDSVEFWERIKCMNLPVDRIECLKKIFNFIPSFEKHILGTDKLFITFLEKVRKNEIKKVYHSITHNKNVWQNKKPFAHCKVVYYYDDLFRGLAEYNIHFWEQRKTTNYFQTIVYVGSCGTLTHITGEPFIVSGLKRFLTRHREIKLLNLLLIPTSDFVVSSNDNLVWFLSLLYDRPINFNIQSNHHYIPENRLIVVEHDNKINIFTS